MKNYFNTQETLDHIYIQALVAPLERLADSGALSAEETKYLRTAVTYIEKASDNIYLRLGAPYMRKVKNTVKCNDVVVKPKMFDGSGKEITLVNHAAIEDLQGGLASVMAYHCFECGRCDWQECGVYAMAVSCGVEGQDTDGCPYKI